MGNTDVVEALVGGLRYNTVRQERQDWVRGGQAEGGMNWCVTVVRDGGASHRLSATF